MWPRPDWSRAGDLAALTEGLLVDHEGAGDAVVAASDGEAVAPEDDVEGLWNVNEQASVC